MNNQSKYRSGLFNDQETAESAYQDALTRGYSEDEINVIMSEDTRKRYRGSAVAKTETGDKSMEGLAVGGAVGGTVVGIIAAVVSLTTTIVIPGLGLVIAGPLAAGLVGAGAGSITGGILGALIGAGIPEEHAKIYQDGIKKGGTLIVVPSRNSKDDEGLMSDWKRDRGSNIY
jgi:hypothetical protein